MDLNIASVAEDFSREVHGHNDRFKRKLLGDNHEISLRRSNFLDLL